MYEPPITFTAEYTDEAVAQAARTFRDFLFKRYGPLLITACVINAIGLLFAFRLGAQADVTLFLMACVVALPASWFLYKYFAIPSQYAAKLRRIFPPRVRVSLALASVSFELHGKEAEIPWSGVKAVVETSALFLLVLSPFAFTFVPRIGMPAAGYEALHARSRYRAA